MDHCKYMSIKQDLAWPLLFRALLILQDICLYKKMVRHLSLSFCTITSRWSNTYVDGLCHLTEDSRVAVHFYYSLLNESEYVLLSPNFPSVKHFASLSIYWRELIIMHLIIMLTRYISEMWILRGMVNTMWPTIMTPAVSKKFV